MGKNTQEGNILDRNLTEREFSSGGVVFKREKGVVLWLVAKSSPSNLFPGTVWRFPKGWVDDSKDDSPGPMARGEEEATEKDLQKAALREVEEEGGVTAEIIDKVGTEKYFFRHPIRGPILKFVTFYLMEWKKDLPQGFDEETSETAWLLYEEARKRLSHSGEKKILDKAKDLLDSLA